MRRWRCSPRRGKPSRRPWDLQERFVDETIKEPDFPLPVGIGLDAGEAVAVEDGFRGGALNLAARLCGQAGPGEILASRGVTHLARRVEGVRYVDRGKVHLKNLTEPVELVRIVPEGANPAERLRTALPPAPPRRRSRVKVAVAIAITLVVVIGAAIALLPAGADPEISAGAVGLLNLSGDLEASVSVGDLPRGLANGAGSLWVTDEAGRSLIRVNPSTSQVQERIAVGAGPRGVAVAAGLVWVVNTDDRTVSMVDPGANRVVQEVVVGNAPTGITADGDRVWVTNSIDATVTEIDATDGSVVDTHLVGEGPVAVAAAAGAVWVANAGDGTISRVVSGDGQTQAYPVGSGPAAIVHAFDALWVANAEAGTVMALDPDTGSVTGTTLVGGDPVALASAGNAVWVASASDGAVHRIDPATSQVTDTFDVGNEPRSLSGTGAGLWVGVEASPDFHRGGTLRLVTDRGVRIDPHALDYPAGMILASVYDGLVTYRRTGGAGGLSIVPDLAVSLPEPVDDGRTYTFTLREGIRFSDGHVLVPRDVVASFERILTAPAAWYARDVLPEIVGASDCTPESTDCDLSRGVVADDADGTVTFHLVEPSPEFLGILAASSYAIVPAGTPNELHREPAPASGPYRITEVGKDGSATLERNPMFREWSADAQPDGFADRIEILAGVPPADQIAMVERGEADFAFDGVPLDLTEELERRASDQLVRSTWPSIGGLALNTSKPPFDNVDARRAVAFALDRAQLLGAWTEPVAENGGGTTSELALVTCQILPPNTFGYRPYCPYSSGSDPQEPWAGPDPAMARELIERSGTMGADVTIGMTPCLGSVAEVVSEMLEGLGYRVRMVTDGPLRVYECQFGSVSPDADVAFTAWLHDHPLPSGFLVPMLACVGPDGAAALTGEFSWNSSFFCDEEIDRRIQRARQLWLTDQHASLRAFQEVERDLVDQAALIPYGTALDLWFVSQRARNVEFHPEIRLLISQVWIH
jgi:ABC-type transport system substrate-binding protein